jgi:hypothetical protein
MKNSERFAASAKAVREWTRSSLISAVATVATARVTSDRRRLQPPGPLA